MLSAFWKATGVISCSLSSIMMRRTRFKITCLLSRTHLMELKDMNLENLSRADALNGLFNSARAGLSSNWSGHQAFNLRIRVRSPLTLLCYFSNFCFLFMLCGFFALLHTRTVFAKTVSARKLSLQIRSKKFEWCCRPAVQDSALSARRSGVQIPSAPPWERSSNGKAAACEAAYTGSIPVLSPISLIRLAKTRCCSKPQPDDHLYDHPAASKTGNSEIV